MVELSVVVVVVVIVVVVVVAAAAAAAVVVVVFVAAAVVTVAVVVVRMSSPYVIARELTKSATGSWQCFNHVAATSNTQLSHDEHDQPSVTGES